MTSDLFIEFKTKVFPIIQDNYGTVRNAIRFKKTLARVDCNLKPQDHDYYNSDLFLSMLNGAYHKVVGTREYCYLDELPLGLSVDTSKFLAVVRIPLERNFNPRGK